MTQQTRRADGYGGGGGVSSSEFDALEASLPLTYAPLSVIQYSQPADGATVSNAALVSLSTPWTDSITVTAALPRVKYEIDISCSNSADALIYAALKIGATIVDNALGYLSGSGRETRVKFGGIITPGAAGAYTFEVLMSSAGAATITVSTTADTSTTPGVGNDGVSSMQLQAVATQ